MIPIECPLTPNLTCPHPGAPDPRGEERAAAAPAEEPEGGPDNIQGRPGDARDLF